MGEVYWLREDRIPAAKKPKVKAPKQKYTKHAKNPKVKAPKQKYTKQAKKPKRSLKS